MRAVRDANRSCETRVAADGWIGFRLIGKGHSGRNAYGALITMTAGFVLPRHARRRLLVECLAVAKDFGALIVRERI